MYHPTSLDIGPDGRSGVERKYRCVTCLHLKVTATSALQHIADGHTVLNQDGVRQELSDSVRRVLTAQKKTA